MCGIVGYIGNNNDGQKVVVEGLKKLEYRGYDSSGIIYYDQDHFEIVRAVGRINNLTTKLSFC